MRERVSDAGLSYSERRILSFLGYKIDHDTNSWTLSTSTDHPIYNLSTEATLMPVDSKAVAISDSIAQAQTENEHVNKVLYQMKEVNSALLSLRAHAPTADKTRIRKILQQILQSV